MNIAHKVGFLSFTCSLSILAITLAQSTADVMVKSTRKDTQSIACIFNEEETDDLNESSEVMLADGSIKGADSILTKVIESSDVPSKSYLATLVSSEVLSETEIPIDDATEEKEDSKEKTDPILEFVEATGENGSISIEDKNDMGEDSSIKEESIVQNNVEETASTQEVESSESTNVETEENVPVETLAEASVKETTLVEVPDTEEQDVESTAETDEMMIGTSIEEEESSIKEDDTSNNIEVASTVSNNDAEEDDKMADKEESSTSSNEISDGDIDTAIIEEDPFGDEVPTDDALIAEQVEESIDYFTTYTDLMNHREITDDEMNYLIDHFVGSRDSSLSGTGHAFITASQSTGYDPIFLLCLAGQEASWTVSKLHKGKNNPYSINMTDANPHGGFTMASTWEDGIIAGAEWIKEKYYDEGQTTLNAMIHGKKRYSSSGDAWSKAICSNMNKCYRVLASY